MKNRRSELLPLCLSASALSSRLPQHPVLARQHDGLERVLQLGNHRRQGVVQVHFTWVWANEAPANYSCLQNTEGMYKSGQSGVGVVSKEYLSEETKRWTKHNFINKILWLASCSLHSPMFWHTSTSSSYLHLCFPLSLSLLLSLCFQWNLPAGVKTAGHFLTAAPVSEGDQRRECAHRRKQPALLLQHHQLDQPLPYRPSESADPQQPKPRAVLWVPNLSPKSRTKCSALLSFNCSTLNREQVTNMEYVKEKMLS